jgi:hypothetical protein
MTLLQLCNRLIAEAGISAQPMTTTANQTGELGRVVNWIQQAWLDIQSAHTTWRWMRESATIATVAGQSGAYDAVALDVNVWTLDTARNYVTASGDITEIFMNFVEYDDFRNSYLYGALRYAQSRPLVFTINPDNTLSFGPVPNGDHTVTIDYYKKPIEMADDSAEPEMPAAFHTGIVWRALMFYGGYEAASEAYNRGMNEYGIVLDKLEANQLPMIQTAGPLA